MVKIHKFSRILHNLSIIRTSRVSNSGMVLYIMLHNFKAADLGKEPSSNILIKIKKTFIFKMLLFFLFTLCLCYFTDILLFIKNYLMFN